MGKVGAKGFRPPRRGENARSLEIEFVNTLLNFGTFEFKD